MQLDLWGMVPWVDAYGHRGLDESVCFLSPWEFTMRWQVRLEESDMASSSVHETEGVPVASSCVIEHSCPLARHTVACRKPNQNSEGAQFRVNECAYIFKWSSGQLS
jgi:hypothetical protein